MASYSEAKTTPRRKSRAVKKANDPSWRGLVIFGGVVGGLYGWSQGSGGYGLVTTPVGAVLGALGGEILAGFLLATPAERAKVWK